MPLLSSLFIDAFFRVLTFILFCLLLAWLIKRYVVESLYALWREHQGEQEQRRHRAGNLAHELELVAIRTKEDEAYYQELQKKMTKWQLAAQLEVDKRQHEQKQQALQVEQKSRRQAQELHRQQVGMVVLERAVQQAKKKLEAIFADQKQGASYIERLITSLKGRE